METKFTKGYWIIKEGDKGSIHSSIDNSLIASAWSTYKSDEIEVREQGESWLNMRKRTEQFRIDADLETLANAKLIAAAPDLLEACVHALEMCQDKVIPTENDLTIMAGRLKQAILKATE